MVWQDWLIVFGGIGLMALVVGLGIVWTRRQHRYIVSRVSLADYNDREVCYARTTSSRRALTKNP